jgi:WD40 repeat protein
MKYKILTFFMLFSALAVHVHAQDMSLLVRAVAWNAKGDKIASIRNDGMTIIQNPDTQEILFSLISDSPGPTAALAFNPANNLLATGGMEGVLKLWDTDTGRLSESFSMGTSNLISGIAWNPASPNLIAVSTYGGILQVWNTSTHASVFTVTSPGASINNIAWSPDGSKIVTLEGYYFRIRNPLTGAISNSNINPGSENIAVDWSVVPNILGVINNTGDLGIWDVDSHAELHHITGSFTNIGDGLTDLRFSPDGKWVVTVGQDGIIRIWDVNTGLLAKSVSTGKYLTAITWSPDGSKVLCGGLYGFIQIFNIQDGMVELPPPAATAARAVAWSPDGTWIARAFENGTVDVIDVQSGSTVFRFDGSPDAATALAWRPDIGSHKLAAAIGKRIYVWQVPNTHPVLTVEAAANEIDSLDWTLKPVDQLVSATYKGPAPNLIVWNPDNGDILFSKGVSQLATAHWDTTGTRLVVAAGIAIRTVDIHSGDLQMLSGNSVELSTPQSVDWSPNGDLIASSGIFGQVTIWDAKSGQERLFYQLPKAVVNQVVFSPDSSKLASASWDGGIRVWDTHTGQQLADIQARHARVFSVDWSPDSTKIVYGTEDGTVQIYEVH